jgi:hypothetical protein
MRRGLVLAALLGWYLMAFNGTAWQRVGAFDTATECRQAATERQKRAERLLNELTAAIEARRAAGEKITRDDPQFMALSAAMNGAIIGLQCEVAQ